MTQSRRLSALESIANVVAGIGIAYTTQVAVFPLFGIQIGHDQHLAITLIFTAVSLVRSYALRRVFNRV